MKEQNPSPRVEPPNALTDQGAPIRELQSVQFPTGDLPTGEWRSDQSQTSAWEAAELKTGDLPPGDRQAGEDQTGALQAGSFPIETAPMGKRRAGETETETPKTGLPMSHRNAPSRGQSKLSAAERKPQLWIVLGAGSAMARPFLRLLAERGDGLLLCGRDLEDLGRLAADARLRGAFLAAPMAFDCRAPEEFATVIARAEDSGAVISVAVFTGSMPEQSQIDDDPALIEGVMADGYTGPAIFLQTLAPLLEAQGEGIVIGVSSVAGDRGRLPNYVYGASKAAFSTYLSGLRNRLARRGVHVMTVKPGLVDTAMIWGRKRAVAGAAPEAVAKAMLRGVERRRNILYVPARWLLIMTVIRLIPEVLFKRLKM